MGTAVDEEFREMELYLQQAQEDIAQALGGPNTAEVTEDDKSSQSATQTEIPVDGEPETTSPGQQGTDAAELVDILCLYDNMEFYHTENKPKCKNDSKAKHAGIVMNSDDEADLDEILDKYVDSRVPTTDSEEDEQITRSGQGETRRENPGRSEQKKMEDRPSQFDKTKNVMIPGNTEWCQRHNKCRSCCMSGSDKIKVSRSLSVGDVEGTVQRFLNFEISDENSCVDDLNPLKFRFQNGKFVRSNSSFAKRHSLKDAEHPKHTDDESFLRQRESKDQSEIQVSPNFLHDRASGGRLQHNQSSDKDKLDNVTGDSDGMSADTVCNNVVLSDAGMSADTACNNVVLSDASGSYDKTGDGSFSTSKPDIDGFVEEIRKSIDSLITMEEKGKQSVSYRNEIGSKVQTCPNESDTKNVVTVQQCNRNRDDNAIEKGAENIRKSNGNGSSNDGGNDIVETEHGYFWLTSTLSDSEQRQQNTASNNKLVENIETPKSTQMKSVRGALKMKKSEDGAKAGSDDKIMDSKKKEGILSKINDVEIIVTKAAKSPEEVHPELPALMTLSTPSFPTLEPPSFNKSHTMRRNSQLTSVSDDNLLQAAAKRKYSAPSLYTVYKVISVDIPKMDPTGHFVDRPKYGDASQKCVHGFLDVSAENRHRNSAPVSDCQNGAIRSFDSFDEREQNSVDICDDDSVKSANFESPLMSNDDSKEKKTLDITTGPIIEPPAAFASVGVKMDVNQPTLPPMVWDPGVSPSVPPGVKHGNITLPDTTYKHLVTPPPPSVDKTEQLISKALNPQYPLRQQQHSDDKHGIHVNKRTDDAMNNGPKVFDKHKRRHKPQHSENNNDINVDFNAVGVVLNKENSKDAKDKVAKSADQTKVMKNDKSSKAVQHSKLKLENGHVNNGMLDLLESYHSEEQTVKSSAIPYSTEISHEPQYASIDSSDSDDKDRSVPNKLEGDNETDEMEQLYAKVVKKNTKSLIGGGKSNHKPLKPIKVSVPRAPELAPPIPERAPRVPIKSPQVPSEAPPVPERKSFPEYDSKQAAFDSKHEHEPSAEFQVMFNSLSPVLLRRRGSTRSNRSYGAGAGGGSVETSPESTPSTSPRTAVHNGNSHIETSENKHLNGNSVNSTAESLFMDPEMSRTWHGATSSNWSQLYGPQMRAMMKELNSLTNGSADSSHSSLDKSEDDFTLTSQTLPSKSLLDQMHKKVCADQYWNSKNSELARALVLLRLKTPPPPARAKAKRSQSFNIRMGMGKSGSSISSESSSPSLPRVSERVRIKTKPGMKYLTRSEQTRAVTPEVLCVEEKPQSHSTKTEDAEIEAVEACRWLKETGFPQYAQLYDDGQFPVDIEAAEKDHDFLDKEDIQSLFRRLNTLNKCAIMKIGTPTKKEAEDSDEDDQCALSDKWKYQRSSRRWSRKDLLDTSLADDKNGQTVLKSASSHDSLLADDNSSSEPGDSPVLDSRMHHTHDDMLIHKMTSHLDANGNSTPGRSPKDIRRVASERIKGAKSFLKRMESLKGRGKTRKPKTVSDISGPVITNNADMQEKLKHLNCKEITHNSENREVQVPRTLELPQADVSANSANSSRVPSIGDESVTSPTESVDLSISSPVTESSSPLDNNTVIDLSSVTTNGALGLDLSPTSVYSNSTDTTTSSAEDLPFLPMNTSRPGRFPKLLDESLFSCDGNIRTRSYSHTPDDEGVKDCKKSRRGSHDPRHKMHRVSIYDNVPVEEDLTVAQQELDIILSELFQNINGLNRAINGEDAELLEPPVSGLFDDSSLSVDSNTPENEPANVDAHSDTTHEPDEIICGTLSSPDISDHELHTEDMSHDDSAEHIVCRERRDSGVGSSLTRTNSDRRKYRIRWHSFQKQHRPTSESRNLLIGSLSAGQILVLRKLSLLKLTALIEKYSPNRSGWSLTVPRFMKRNKVPDYRDKNVFGVPFAVMIQRSGQALPQCILHALRYLRRTASDALGIFRKSGVRSRIQKLRNDLEAKPESIDFDSLQAYDVADLVKQYFRELPECLLTSKLSDIFISIFIYVPVDQRLEALQAAVILMADENRDVLQSLLLFLSDIARQHNQHQMTASNLAVCFAPSLFNMGGARNPNQTPSPRRNRKNPGIPDARELMEQKAAHECLTVMIQECKKLFTIPAGTLSKCRVRHGDTVTLDQLNSSPGDATPGYTAYIDDCIQGLLKESREKFRGWVSVPVHTAADVSYKKVGDGHPLRLWKCTVDVEAPPSEVLDRVLSDRQMWDEDLLQWNSVEKLDKQTEVFHFVRNSMAPHPTRDFCVLRSWRTDLPKGACVLISTSIEHASAEPQGDIRAVELASRYLIEPCGTGKSRLTHISRVDIRGHSPDWYKKVYGHLCANFMEKIRLSFVKVTTDGPETKV